MEHPAVLREIDRLIESYNWDGVRPSVDSPDISLILKKLIRASDQGVFVKIKNELFDSRRHRFPAYSVETLALIECLVDVLKHSSFRNKEAILRVLYDVIRECPRINNSVSQEIHLLLIKEVPLFISFLHSRNKFYRLLATYILVKFESQVDTIVQALLSLLKRERSTRNFALVSFFLADFISKTRIKQSIAASTKQSLLSYAEQRMKSQNSLIAVTSAGLYFVLVPPQQSNTAFEVLVSSWPRVQSGFEQETVRFMHRYRHISVSPHTLSLLIKSPTRGIAEALITAMLDDEFDHGWIALTPAQKIVMESALKCRALWREKSRRSSYVITALPSSRQALRQQLRHARIVDEQALKQPEAELLLFWDGSAIQRR